MADDDASRHAGDDDGSRDGTDDDQTQDQLGDAGKRAIDEERRSRRAAEKRVRDLESELVKLRERTMSDQEKAIEKARREAMAEATSASNRRLLQAEVRAAAAGKLADPEDAVRFIDLDEFQVNDDGTVDTKTIAAAIQSLVKTKPYLAAGATRPTGDADQGARGARAPSSMNDMIRNAIRR